MSEIRANSRVVRKKDYVESLVSNVTRFSTAWIDSDEILPLVIYDPFIKAAKSRDWLLSGKRKYLLNFYKDVNGQLIEEVGRIKIARLSAKEDDDDDYMCVETMLLDCWHRNNVSKDDLKQIITEFAK